MNFKKIFIRALFGFTLAFLALIVWSYFSMNPTHRKAIQKIERQKIEMKKDQIEKESDSLINKWASEARQQKKE